MTRSSGLWVVTNLYPWPDEPNRATFNAQQFQALAQHCRLHVFVPVPWYRYKSDWGNETQSGAVSVHYFPFYYIPRFGLQYHGRQLWFSLKRAVRKLKLPGPEAVLGSFAFPDGYASARLAKTLGVPYSIKVHGNDINVKAKSAALRKPILQTLQGAKAIVSVSQALADSVVTLGVASSKISVVYNGIDANVFNADGRDQARSNLNLPENRQHVLFVGNLKTSKGCVRLAKAAAQESYLQNVSIHFVGHGPASKQIKVMQEQGARNLHLYGVVNHEQLPDWYRAVDLVCLPSDNEGVPNVLLEAMACGTPVLATDVGGIKEVVAPAAGHLLAADASSEDLAQALLSALQSPWNAAEIAASVADKRWDASARQLAAATAFAPHVPL